MSPRFGISWASSHYNFAFPIVRIPRVRRDVSHDFSRNLMSVRVNPILYADAATKLSRLCPLHVCRFLYVFSLSLLLLLTRSFALSSLLIFINRHTTSNCMAAYATYHRTRIDPQTFADNWVFRRRKNNELARSDVLRRMNKFLLALIDSMGPR